MAAKKVRKKVTKNDELCWLFIQLGGKFRL